MFFLRKAIFGDELSKTAGNDAFLLGLVDTAPRTGRLGCDGYLQKFTTCPPPHIVWLTCLGPLTGDNKGGDKKAKGVQREK